MSTYTKQNLNEVENQAPKFGMPSELEARFVRTALEGETLGLSLMTLAPNFRIPFGHKHEGQEEVYVVLRGSARIKVEDEIVELGPMDACESPWTRCGTSRPARRVSSTSPSAPATTLRTPRWCRTGGETDRRRRPGRAARLVASSSARCRNTTYGVSQRARSVKPRIRSS